MLTESLIIEVLAITFVFLIVHSTFELSKKLESLGE
jgi:hypothetical protein